MGSDCSKHSQHTFEELCIEALKRANCRITNPRRTVIQCLAKAKKPLTAPEVFEKISKQQRGGKADRVSVYRTLETLHELRLIHRTMPSGGYLACGHQECIDSYHVLSRCTDCNQVEELDVPSEVVAPLLFHLQNTLQFTPDSHILHMEGHCSTCAS